MVWRTLEVVLFQEIDDFYHHQSQEAITVGPLALPEIGSPSQQAASDPPTSSASSSAGRGPLDGESVTMDHAPSGATDQTMHTAVSLRVKGARPQMAMAGQ